jgi:uncharacterized protein
MIPDDIREEIMRRLGATEKNENVKILLAVESGSRAWGFASPNSDYDVRFIYARPKDWYVAVDFEEKRDVIEYAITDDIDLNGWDVRKALRLFWRSNPAFVEWIQSPIIYIQSGSFAQNVRALLPEIYACDRGIYHYRSMAKRTYRDHLCGEVVPLKKYFYVLRALLAVQWLEAYGTPAPIEFQKLLHLLESRPDLLAAIDALLEKKKAAQEMQLAPPVRILNEFIESKMERLENFMPEKLSRDKEMAKLNDIFHHVLQEKIDA